MWVNSGWEIPMNRLYFEHIPEIGTKPRIAIMGSSTVCINSPNVRPQTLQTTTNARTCFPWADHVRRFRQE